MGGVEPPRLAPPPPQDGESTKFLHIGKMIYGWPPPLLLVAGGVSVTGGSGSGMLLLYFMPCYLSG